MPVGLLLCIAASVFQFEGGKALCVGTIFSSFGSGNRAIFCDKGCNANVVTECVKRDGRSFGGANYTRGMSCIRFHFYSLM